MRPIERERDLYELARAARVLAVVQAWAASGLFHRLADQTPRPVEALPGDPRALAITAAILGHVGLLTCVSSDGVDRWTLSRAGAALLHSGALTGLGGLDDLTRLEAVLAEGGPVPGPDGQRRPTRGGVRDDDPAAMRAFLEGLYRRSADSAPDTARLIASILPPEGRSALDLGGGHGRYAAELAARGFQATLFDRPAVLAAAAERHGDTLSYRAGDFEAADFGVAVAGGPYDVVLGSNVVHGLGPEALRALLQRLRGVVKPGGLLVLKDMFLDESALDPEPAVLFGLTMLMYTAAGQSYRVGDLRAWLAEAGFPGMEPVSVRDQGYALLVAR